MSGGLRTQLSRRAVALVFFVVAVAIVLGATGLPIYFVNEYYDSEIARLQRQLKTFTALSRQEPQLVKAVEILKEREPRKFFLKGASSALASAELQDVVKATVEGNGGRMLSTQAAANIEESGYRRLSATFQITANIQNLRRILYVLEANQPYLFVDNLTIRSQVPANFKPTPGVEPDLFVQFDIAGYSMRTTSPEVVSTKDTKVPDKAKP